VQTKCILSRLPGEPYTGLLKGAAGVWSRKSLISYYVKAEFGLAKMVILSLMSFDTCRRLKGGSRGLGGRAMRLVIRMSPKRRYMNFLARLTPLQPPSLNV